MGLDIIWCRNITKVLNADAYDKTKWEEYEQTYGDHFQPYVNPKFPGRANDVENGATYTAEEFDAFNAGSYGGYNAWRDELAVLAGYESARDVWAKKPQGPFVELINFSDCEGTIGAAVSAKLARDFAEHQAKADAHPDEYFREKYREWQGAFEKAADRGCVRFV